MSSAVCKICGREYREGRQCPEHDGEIVCISCCKKCRYHRDRDYGNPCEWHRYNKKIDYDVEIKKLDLQIEALRQKVRYYYKRSWTDSARKKEHEVEMLLRLKRRMMEERDRISDVSCGVIGLDFNDGFLSFSETDAYGNLIGLRHFPLNSHGMGKKAESEIALRFVCGSAVAIFLRSK